MQQHRLLAIATAAHGSCCCTAAPSTYGAQPSVHATRRFMIRALAYQQTLQYQSICVPRNASKPQRLCTASHVQALPLGEGTTNNTRLWHKPVTAVCTCHQHCHRPPRADIPYAVSSVGCSSHVHNMACHYYTQLLLRQQHMPLQLLTDGTTCVCQAFMLCVVTQKLSFCQRHAAWPVAVAISSKAHVPFQTMSLTAQD